VVREKSATGINWSRIPVLLRSDKAYRRFVTARSVANLGRLAMPFYILYAADHTALTGPNLALLTIAFTLAGSTSNLIWGALADRGGYRRVILLSLTLWIFATLALFVTEGVWLTSLVLFGIGAAIQGFKNAASNIVLEFGEREDLPMRLAISNSSSELATTIATLSAGGIATWMGYEAVFIVSITFLLAGTLLIRRQVPDPRHRLS